MRRAPRVALLALAAFVVGCASGTPPRAPDAGHPAVAAASGRLLYRAAVETPEGSLDVRLVLARDATGAFELEARDAFGRGVWQLRAAGAQALWSDEGRGIYCRLAPDVPLRLPGIEWDLPVGALPDLLSGAYPRAPATGREGAVEVVELGTWTFRGVREAGVWSTWTLREGGAPSAWWTRSGEESLLVLRNPPLRVRWRLTARAPLERRVAPIEPPPGGREVECRDGEIP